MDDKVMAKATEYIDALAAKLGVAAEHVYGILVKQAFAEGIVSLAIGVLLLIGLIIGLVFAVKAFKEIADGLDVFELTLLIAIPVVIAFAVGASTLGQLTDGIKHVINPEYYAIKEILDAIGGGK
jgi:hypothetical protein